VAQVVALLRVSKDFWICATFCATLGGRWRKKSEGGSAVNHPIRLIVSWRASIEQAARRADIAIAGPYTPDNTVHLRRVHTLNQLAHHSPTQHRWLLRRLLLFDKAAARGNEPDIQRHGTQMVACWEAVARAAAKGSLQQSRLTPAEAAARREPCSQQGQLVVRDRHVELGAGRIRGDALDLRARLAEELVQSPCGLSVQSDD